MRTRKKKWAAGELADNPMIIRDTADYKRQMRGNFANDNPVHLELGCGKGRFITEMSLAHPNVNFIAIERDPTILAAAARLAREKGAASIAFIVADVNDIQELINPGDVSRMYINFCDPWHRRKKQAKRRLTYDSYLIMYEKLLIPELYFKTDNRILFESSIECLSRRGWLMKNISLDLHNSLFEGNIMTEYEEKFKEHGPIYRLEACPPIGAVNPAAST